MKQAQEQGRPDVMLTAEAARTLGLSTQRVRQLADAGDLPVYAVAQPCGTRIFERAQVLAFGRARIARVQP